MGDPMRHTSPFNECYLYPLHDTRPMTGTGLGFVNANSNEFYITLDYHVPESKPVFYNLVKMTDGLTECYRIGTFDRWKQSYRYLQELNPRFIYVWGGGFGYGPKVFGGSYDILGQAHAGLASVTGTHEDFGGHATKCTNWNIDWYSGSADHHGHPVGPLLAEQDGSRHHDRVLPGAGRHPLSGATPHRCTASSASSASAGATGTPSSASTASS